MRTTAVLLAAASAFASGSSFSVSINGSATPHIVADAFVGFTTDYWLNNGPYGDKWAPDGGILTLNLSDPRLINLVKAVTPATWRIGGTPADSVVYVVGSQTECPDVKNPPQKPWPQTKCLTMDRWQEIQDFRS